MRIKNLVVNIISLFLMVILSCSFSCPGGDNNNKEIIVTQTPKPPKKKGIIAIVFADLTGSINEETANRVKRNVGELFKQLPAETNFYLYTIDRGTSKPDIYNFTPKFTEIKVDSDEEKRKEETANNQELKNTIELEKLNKSLNDYQNYISSQKGAVSCLSNKLNFLSDSIKNKSDSYPEYAVKIYFYSDMLEECENSFDGKPLDFKKKATDAEEEKHLQEIENRIGKGFNSTLQFKDLKSLRTKIHVILTSQDDKQELGKLKTLWAKIFGKFGYLEEDINDKTYFYWGDGTDKILWELEK